MPIDLVIDDREGGSKSDSEEITRSSGPLDQVREGVHFFPGHSDRLFGSLSLLGFICIRLRLLNSIGLKNLE